MDAKSVLAFDLDGTLTKRNTVKIVPESLPALFTYLNSLNHNIIPITGKPAPYALRILKQNNLEQRGIIAENAGVYIPPGITEPQIYGTGIESVFKLKELLGLKADSKGVTNIFINGSAHEVVIDPEDFSILTIFTDPSTVSHRWQFKQTIGTKEVHAHLVSLVQNNNLSKNLFVLPPFPDGGLQVVRKDEQTGKIIDKSRLPEVVLRIIGNKQTVPIAMFGDGHNDIPAMGAPGVVALTFNNAEQIVKDFVKEKNGYVSPYDAPEDLGVVDCIYWLAKNTNHFGEDSESVQKKVNDLLSESIKKMNDLG